MLKNEIERRLINYMFVLLLKFQFLSHLYFFVESIIEQKHFGEGIVNNPWLIIGKSQCVLKSNQVKITLKTYLRLANFATDGELQEVTQR